MIWNFKTRFEKDGIWCLIKKLRKNLKNVPKNVLKSIKKLIDKKYSKSFDFKFLIQDNSKVKLVFDKMLMLKLR